MQVVDFFKMSFFIKINFTFKDPNQHQRKGKKYESHWKEFLIVFFYNLRKIILLYSFRLIRRPNYILDIRTVHGLFLKSVFGFAN